MGQDRWSMRKAFSMVQVVVILLVAVSLLSIATAYHNTRNAIVDTVERSEQLNELFRYNEFIKSMARDYLFQTRDTEEIMADYRSTTAALHQDMERLIQSAALPTTRTYLQSLQNMFRYYLNSIEAMMGHIQNGNKDMAYQSYNEVAHRSGLIQEVVVPYNTLYASDVGAYATREIEEYRQIQIFQTAVSICLLVVSLVFLSITLNHALRHIQKLVECTEYIAKGDYTYIEKQNFPHDKDWGSLGLSMQQMAASIKYYLGEMEEKNRLTVEMATMENEQLRMASSMREAEWKALNNQMSPHMIYNTLNIALQLAYEEKAPKTITMMRTIIAFLRYYTKNASAITDLYSELEFLNNYIYINQKRYGDRIQFIVEVEPELENIKLPAVILQPLVENAIIHGLKNCVENGLIRVSVLTEGTQLNISVEDNGEGIPYDRIEALLSAEPGSADHVGLRNVERRLKIFFGEGAGVSINSELGVGTIVTIHIPQRNGAEKTHE